MDSLTETLTCPVCFEDFEEDGDRVPRLLPCTHSLCHTCVDQWIRNNQLECPSCRVKHEVKREENTFPQNKYILTMVRRRRRLEGDELNESRRCPEHGQNEILFCMQAGCHKTICTLCLSKAHFGHKVVAINDEREEVLAQLLKNIEITKKRLSAKTKHVEQVSRDAARKTEVSLLQAEKEREQIIQHLEKKKEDIIKKYDEKIQKVEKEIEEIKEQYDEMTKQAEDKKNEQNESSKIELAAMKDNEVLLTSMKHSIEKEENTYGDAMKKLDTVKSVTETVKDLPQVKKYEYSEYVPGDKNLPGKLVKKVMLVSTKRELLRQGQYNINSLSVNFLVFHTLGHLTDSSSFNNHYTDFPIVQLNSEINSAHI